MLGINAQLGAIVDNGATPGLEGFVEDIYGGTTRRQPYRYLFYTALKSAISFRSNEFDWEFLTRTYGKALPFDIGIGTVTHIGEVDVRRRAIDCSTKGSALKIICILVDADVEWAEQTFDIVAATTSNARAVAVANVLTGLADKGAL